MAVDVDASSVPGPFEGPEKLLEIWFAPSPAHVPNTTTTFSGKSGLRAVDRKIWEDMLDIVKCKVLSVINGEEIDAYLLSESSLFISPHRLILKTCGTTLNLLGLPRILTIARTYAKLTRVYRCFYSRKSFMFPERQLGPHREWRQEVDFLDRIFDNGSAYTVGKVNGDHWLLYITGPDGLSSGSSTEGNSPIRSSLSLSDERSLGNAENEILSNHNPLLSPPAQDYTIEILMTHLSSRVRSAFFMPATVVDSPDLETEIPFSYAQVLSTQLGITDIFPRHLTQLDAYSFSPCGYSSNALLKWSDNESVSKAGEGYYTIHVTPEEGSSYASFECNVPLPTNEPFMKDAEYNSRRIPDLQTLIRRVVRIFEPGKLTLTLFISSAENNNSDDDEGETAVEVAQRAFNAALTRPSRMSLREVANGLTEGSDNQLAIREGTDRIYKRSDKINYEFGGYDLAFATFDVRDGV